MSVLEIYKKKLSTDNPAQKPDMLKSVNANEEFTLMYRSKLGEHYILYGAETDGVDSNVLIDLDSQINEISPTKFIELKTSRFIQNERQDRNFKKYFYVKEYVGLFVFIRSRI